MALGSSLKSQAFDPVNADEEQLKTLVMQKINARRLKHHHKELVLNAALQKTADEYVAAYRYYKFENNTMNRKRINRKIKKVCRANGYANAFLDFQTLSQNGLSYYGNRFYYDREDDETSTHLFLGNKPTAAEKKKESFKTFPVKTYTYEELANIISRAIIRDDGAFNSLNNGYDKYGFALAVDKGTMFRRKIPRIKVILILGGNLITW